MHSSFESLVIFLITTVAVDSSEWDLHAARLPSDDAGERGRGSHASSHVTFGVTRFIVKYRLSHHNLFIFIACIYYRYIEFPRTIIKFARDKNGLSFSLLFSP